MAISKFITPPPANRPKTGAPCLVDGCSTPWASFGYCQKHYYRWKRHGDPHVVKWPFIPISEDGTKRLCNSCQTMLPWEVFFFDKKTGKHRGQCRDCVKKLRQQRDERDPERTERIKRQGWLRRRFAITLEAYETLFNAQGGACAICGRPEYTRSLAVDHDHTTGVVRGLLCTRCNLRLGNLEKSEWSRAARRYLAHHANLQAQQALSVETLPLFCVENTKDEPS
jgi:hypothetical protein